MSWIHSECPLRAEVQESGTLSSKQRENTGHSHKQGHSRAVTLPSTQTESPEGEEAEARATPREGGREEGAGKRRVGRSGDPGRWRAEQGRGDGRKHTAWERLKGQANVNIMSQGHPFGKYLRTETGCRPRAAARGHTALMEMDLIFPSSGEENKHNDET